MVEVAKENNFAFIYPDDVTTTSTIVMSGKAVEVVDKRIGKDSFKPMEYSTFYIVDITRIHEITRLFVATTNFCSKLQTFGHATTEFVYFS